MVIDALTKSGRKVKATPGGWVAQCPAHEDREPSLSIRRGRGRVLMYCHGGCDTGTVADALGLRMDDLFDEKRIGYEYRDSGKLLRTVWRTPGKKFSQQVADSSQVSLYRLDEVRAAVVSGRDIYIPEGEQDVDTLMSAGYVATTSPMGATNWSKANWEPLRGVCDLFVLADADEPGMERARGLAAHLATLTTGVVRVLKARVGKDVTDHITAGFDVADMVPVEVEPIEDPFEVAVEDEAWRELVRIEARQRARDRRNLVVSDSLAPKTLGDLLAIEHPYEWLVPDLLERQDRVVLTGIEGHGKSVLLRQFVVTMAAGIHPFNLRTQVEPCRALVIDAENSERQWSRTAQYITSLVERHGTGDARTNVLVAAGIRIDLSKQADVNQVHRLIDRHRPDMLYIGPLYKLVSKAITTDDDAAPLFVALDGFRERGLTMLLEAHAGHALNQGARDLRPRGSSALLGWPEYGIGLSPIDPYEDPDMYRLDRWRGDREVRVGWPPRVRKGAKDELPWEPSW